MEAAVDEPDWLGACRRIVAELRAMLAEHATTSERAVELGRGRGGDRTLVIDDAAERLIFAELDSLRAAGHAFTVISEERGEVDFGSSELRVVVDPIDGSLNAKRGLWPHAVSIAVADGPTMADVGFAFVHDFGAEEEWTARRGAGAALNAHALAGSGERRTAAGSLELVAIESARPAQVAAGLTTLAGVAHRLRSYGSIAFSLCQLAGARVDGMATLLATRSVDAAAGQLIVRESGGSVAFTAFADPLGMPLDIDARSPVVAARSARALRELAALPAEAERLRSSER
jgi:myo-inositol-1(or 4)-monophosphatase